MDIETRSVYTCAVCRVTFSRVDHVHGRKPMYCGGQCRRFASLRRRIEATTGARV